MEVVVTAAVGLSVVLLLLPFHVVPASRYRPGTMEGTSSKQCLQTSPRSQFSSRTLVCVVLRVCVLCVCV